MTLKERLLTLADKYEREDFIIGDPSWFMHQVEGNENKEILAFVAASLSYGSRKQFMPKIQFLLDCSIKKNVTFEEWVRTGIFKKDIPYDDKRCFYRLYTYADMHRMLCVLQELILDYGSLKEFIVTCSESTPLACIDVIEALVEYFSSRGIEGIIPKNVRSSCKRICMFVRWMVRDNSPVDLGLWKDVVDKRTLIIPLDTHVLQEANRLGLMQSKAASMASAMKLTEMMREFFPDDPLKGDYALFGLGVDR